VPAPPRLLPMWDSLLLAPADRAALEREGERLAAFIADREPDVYRRYRTSRARRLA
jgi:hypothetical protein